MELTCTSPYFIPILWSLMDSNITLMPPVFEIDGDASHSTLTINSILLAHSGVYVCQVEDVVDTIRIDVQLKCKGGGRRGGGGGGGRGGEGRGGEGRGGEGRGGEGRGGEGRGGEGRGGEGRGGEGEGEGEGRGGEGRGGGGGGEGRGRGRGGEGRGGEGRGGTNNTCPYL